MKNKILRHIRATIVIILFSWLFILFWIFNDKSLFSMVKEEYRDFVKENKKRKRRKNDKEKK